MNFELNNTFYYLKLNYQDINICNYRQNNSLPTNCVTQSYPKDVVPNPNHRSFYKSHMRPNIGSLLLFGQFGTWMEFVGL